MSNKFKEGDEVKMNDEVTNDQNSNSDYLKTQKLKVVRYPNQKEQPEIVECWADGTSQGLYQVTETQIHKIKSE